MKDYPLLMQSAMVRATLADLKSQTRRVMKPQPTYIDVTIPDLWRVEGLSIRDAEKACRCPYGKPGTRLWVRETWALGADETGEPKVFYRATDSPTVGVAFPRKPAIEAWKSSIYMPRWASRLTLEICEVRVQRVQEISEEDAIAEGVFAWRDTWTTPKVAGTNWLKSMQHLGIKSIPIRLFATLWDSINGKKYPWESNPYVFALTFRKVEQP